MTAIDTNILVRYIVRDDEGQWGAAAALLRRHAASEDPIFIPISVFLELEWVLRSRFKFSKSRVLEAFDELLAAEEVMFESPLAVRVALRAYQRSAADLADCLHLALASQAGECPLWTFDRRASRLSGARILAARDPESEDVNESQTGDESPTDRPPPVSTPWMASRC